MADKETGHENEMNFESALENYLNTDFGELEEGSIVKGEIVRVDDDNVLVDVNFKSEGQIPASEFRDSAGNMTVKVGDKVTTSKYSGTEVKVDGEEYTIVRQSDILAIVE